MPRITKNETPEQRRRRLKAAMPEKYKFQEKSAKEILKPLREQIETKRAASEATQTRGRVKRRGPKYLAKDGGLFGDPIKRAQRKAKREMKKGLKDSAKNQGPTRKVKRQQKRGLRQMRSWRASRQ